jgi:hypothetical protein
VAVTVIGASNPTVSEINAIAGITAGPVTATTQGLAATLTGLSSGTGDVISMTVTDTSTSAPAVLAGLAAKTSVAVDASAVSSVTGSAADVVSFVSETGVTKASDFTVSVSGTASVSQVNTIDSGTSGNITAEIPAAAVSDLTSLETGGTDAITLTVTSTSIDPADLIGLDAKTSVRINASSVETVTGTAANIALFRSAIDADSIQAYAGFDAVLTDTTTVSALAISNVASPGLPNPTSVDASSVLAITGSASEVIATYALANVSGLGNEAITLSETSNTIDADQLSAVVALVDTTVGSYN